MDRSQPSTVDAMASVVEIIRTEKMKEENYTAVFLDLQKAFIFQYSKSRNSFEKTGRL